ncbi:hypothetical protein [Ekhidna sp.]|jgi:hypothetical protein|uniref:hypothetical protein n=1 Tax=Ekhidna sp. TaxID=2608089 RepID=UPI0032F0264F
MPVNRENQNESTYDPFEHSRTYSTWYGHTYEEVAGGYVALGMDIYDADEVEEQSSNQNTVTLSPS